MQRCLQPSGWAGPQRGTSLGMLGMVPAMLDFTVRWETAGSETGKPRNEGRRCLHAHAHCCRSKVGVVSTHAALPSSAFLHLWEKLASQQKRSPAAPPPISFHRFADALDDAHAPERLGKFEELLEAAVDMARVPDEYVISPTYDAVRPAP